MKKGNEGKEERIKGKTSKRVKIQMGEKEG